MRAMTPQPERSQDVVHTRPYGKSGPPITPLLLPQPFPRARLGRAHRLVFPPLSLLTATWQERHFSFVSSCKQGNRKARRGSCRQPKATRLAHAGPHEASVSCVHSPLAPDLVASRKLWLTAQHHEGVSYGLSLARGKNQNSKFKTPSVHTE